MPYISRDAPPARRSAHRSLIAVRIVIAAVVLVTCGVWMTRWAISRYSGEGVPDNPAVFEPLPPAPEIRRIAPKRFPRGTSLPNRKEMIVCGAPGTYPFNPDADLVLVHDYRAWWESDHHKNGTENDHEVHRAMAGPLAKVIDAVSSSNAILKIHDSYRPHGVHVKWSLHREGRAVDLTAQGMSLEDLAKICWVAGFDWVYYEKPRKGGEHVHCSVKARRRVPNPNR